jgi:hypothetical protein
MRDVLHPLHVELASRTLIGSSFKATIIPAIDETSKRLRITA